MIILQYHEDFFRLAAPVGCAILPKVLGLISDVDFPIPLPMNKSPSEKNPTFFIFKVPPTTPKFIVYSVKGKNEQISSSLKNHRRIKAINFNLTYV